MTRRPLLMADDDPDPDDDRDDDEESLDPPFPYIVRAVDWAWVMDGS